MDSDASIYQKYHFDIDIFYRIVYRPWKYHNFLYTDIDFLIYHLAKFSHVLSRSCKTFTESLTEFVILRKFCAIFHYYQLVRFLESSNFT